MSNMQERMLAELPTALFKFLDTLTGNELEQLDKLDPTTSSQSLSSRGGL